MNREILFRGRRYDSGEWVYGLLTIMWGQYVIIDMGDENTAYRVDPSTVGQYTGLTDKNGEKIFEWDILLVQEPEDPCGKIPPVYGVVKFSEYEENHSKHIGFYVEWKNNKYGDYSKAYRKDLGYWSKCRHCEVCGNIHDNPVLLQEG